ncbi:hypothetical protein [Synechocystis sp. PCC 7509]|nr:hypothetical protein [Synechocystis sp. PCC 7509]
MNQNLQLISNRNFDEGMMPQTVLTSDQRLLDAYSQSVIGVVDY